MVELLLLSMQISLLMKAKTVKKHILMQHKECLLLVVASVLTTLAAFSPLMIWPGISGKLCYLPITVFAVLAASLAYALIFAPAIGSLLGRRKSPEEKMIVIKPQLRKLIKKQLHSQQKIHSKH